MGSADSIKTRLQRKRIDLKSLFDNNTQIKNEAIHLKTISNFEKAIEECSKIQLDPHPSIEEFELWRNKFQDEITGLIHEREVRRSEERAQWQPKAISLIEQQEYKEALLCLENIHLDAWNDEITELRDTLQNKLNRLTELRNSITRKIEKDEFRTILPMVEECLSIKAAQEDLIVIRNKLIKHNQTNEQRNKLALQQAQAHIKNLEFGLAKSSLSQFDERDLLPATSELLRQVTKLDKQCEQISALRQRNFGRFGYKRKLGRIKAYERLLGEVGAVDPHVNKDKQTIAELRRRLKNRLWSYVISIAILTATYLVVVELVERLQDEIPPAEKSIYKLRDKELLTNILDNHDSLNNVETHCCRRMPMSPGRHS